eukprot:GCRY01006060.1.p1 GENE.GCRY01006060.1~~GCRY01006060.1.p1  ORF type:complete len:579 (-),score=140.03 GCRY01006060.1:47-1783(-)
MSLRAECDFWLNACVQVTTDPSFSFDYSRLSLFLDGILTKLRAHQGNILHFLQKQRTLLKVLGKLIILPDIVFSLTCRRQLLDCLFLLLESNAEGDKSQFRSKVLMFLAEIVSKSTRLSFASLPPALVKAMAEMDCLDILHAQLCNAELAGGASPGLRKPWECQRRSSSSHTPPSGASDAEHAADSAPLAHVLLRLVPHLNQDDGEAAVFLKPVFHTFITGLTQAKWVSARTKGVNLTFPQPSSSSVQLLGALLMQENAWFHRFVGENCFEDLLWQSPVFVVKRLLVAFELSPSTLGAVGSSLGCFMAKEEHFFLLRFVLSRLFFVSTALLTNSGENGEKIEAMGDDKLKHYHPLAFTSCVPREKKGEKEGEREDEMEGEREREKKEGGREREREDESEGESCWFSPCSLQGLWALVPALQATFDKWVGESSGAPSQPLPKKMKIAPPLDTPHLSSPPPSLPSSSSSLPLCVFMDGSLLISPHLLSAVQAIHRAFLQRTFTKELCADPLAVSMAVATVYSEVFSPSLLRTLRQILTNSRPCDEGSASTRPVTASFGEETFQKFLWKHVVLPSLVQYLA